MAVLDHAVHDKTREASGAVWGCHSRPDFKTGYWAPDRRYREDGTFEVIQTWVPHFGALECRNDFSLSNSKCDGCPRRGTGEAYVADIRARGA